MRNMKVATLKKTPHESLKDYFIAYIDIYIYFFFKQINELVVKSK